MRGRYTDGWRNYVQHKWEVFSPALLITRETGNFLAILEDSYSSYWKKKYHNRINKMFRKSTLVKKYVQKFSYFSRKSCPLGPEIFCVKRFPHSHPSKILLGFFLKSRFFFSSKLKMNSVWCHTKAIFWERMGEGSRFIVWDGHSSLSLTGITFRRFSAVN